MEEENQQIWINFKGKLKAYDNFKNKATKVYEVMFFDM